MGESFYERIASLRTCGSGALVLEFRLPGCMRNVVESHEHHVLKGDVESAPLLNVRSVEETSWEFP